MKSANYRDVIVDAMAEVFDEWSIRMYCHYDRMLAATTGHSDGGMRGLFAFRYALEWYPRTREHAKPQFDDVQFEAMWRQEFAKLPEDKTTRTNHDFWETYMSKGLCRFHEHAAGNCWRMGGPKTAGGAKGRRPHERL